MMRRTMEEEEEAGRCGLRMRRSEGVDRGGGEWRRKEKV